MSNRQISAEDLAMERQMHEAFSGWAADHKQRYNHMGVLPYDPEHYPDQRLEISSRRIKSPEMPSHTGRASRAAFFLKQTAYLKALKLVYVKSVQSKELANSIINDFQSKPAFPGYNNPSIAEYVVNKLDEDGSVGIVSGHVDRLTDIADFTAGLNLAVAEENGLKYIDRFRILVNKNMTRETYFKVPIPTLMSIGVGVYWGLPPGKSAEKFGITPEISKEVNKRVSHQIVTDKKEKSFVLGFVPAGSGMEQSTDPKSSKLLGLTIKDSSYTAPLLVRCEGGVIPVNRYGDESIIGTVMETTRPEGINKKDFEKILADKVVETFAKQTMDLAGVSVQYTKLSKDAQAGTSVYKPATDF
jgi:hypothetical protein